MLSSTVLLVLLRVSSASVLTVGLTSSLDSSPSTGSASLTTGSGYSNLIRIYNLVVASFLSSFSAFKSLASSLAKTAASSAPSSREGTSTIGFCSLRQIRARALRVASMTSVGILRESRLFAIKNLSPYEA